MKTSVASIILLLSPIVATALDLGFYPGIKSEKKPGFDEVHALAKKADRVVWLNEERKFDLGLGKITEGGPTSNRI